MQYPERFDATIICRVQPLKLSGLEGLGLRSHLLCSILGGLARLRVRTLVGVEGVKELRFRGLSFWGSRGLKFGFLDLGIRIRGFGVEEFGF